MLNNLVSQATNFWQRQKSTQRIMLISGVIVLVIVIPVLISWASQPSYSVAFNGLTEEDASSIVESLKASDIPYKLSGTGSILVPSDQVYDVRLTMAGEGLPKGSSTGFELFTGSTIGMTEFTQRVNYQQAMEGELERTISSLDQIAAVRVHIVTPEKSLLVSDQTPTTASITVEEKPGKDLDAATVRAITYLVANAVEGLKPENVVVVDTNGDLLASGSGDEGLSGSLSQLDSRRAAELAVSNDLQKKVRNLLDTALGPNRSVVQVNVALDWRDQEITTHSFEATPNAVFSSEKSSESYVITDGTTGGIPGAATNLPTAVPAGATGTTNPTLYTKTDEKTNYEMASTESHEIIHPGQIKMVALSVLVDGVSDQEQLTKIQTAISAAVGIDAARGDQISVQTLAFDKTYSEAQAEEMASSERNNTFLLIGEIAAVVIVLGLLLWYVQRLLRNLRMASVDVWDPVLKPMNLAAALPSKTPSSAGDMLQLSQAAQQSLMSGDKVQTVQSVMSAVVKPQPKQQPISVEDQKMQQIVQRMAEDNPASVAEIIQMWLSQDKANNG